MSMPDCQENRRVYLNHLRSSPISQCTGTFHSIDFVGNVEPLPLFIDLSIHSCGKSGGEGILTLWDSVGNTILLRMRK